MREYYGTTLGEVIQKSLYKKQTVQHQTVRELTKKGRFLVWAPPLVWGPWVEVWAQLGVTGPQRNSHRAIVNVSFDHNIGVSSPSTFNVEIKGGDRIVRAIGPGSTQVTVTGNVATSLSIRCKSHSTGQQVLVQA